MKQRTCTTYMYDVHVARTARKMV